MSRYELPSGAGLHIRRGDITKVSTDAIVNAANTMMLGGGGVDGAIHRAAGRRLLEACYRVPSVDGIRCPVGEARITPGFELPARWVIHTVGPRYHRHPEPAAALASAFRNSLRLANAQDGVRSVAFPAISCGAYGYPFDEAAEIAVREAAAGAGALEAVWFVLFGQDELAAWERAAEAASLRRVAEAGDWKHQPLPEARARLDLEMPLSAAEMRALSRGLLPQQMEDKWFVFREGDRVRFCRSWTGFCIYEVRLTAAGVAEAWVSRDAEQYTATDDAQDARWLRQFLSGLSGRPG